MRASGVCGARAGWPASQKGSRAPPLCPWALNEGAWTTKLPLIVGERGGPPGGASLSSKGSVPRLFHGAGDNGGNRALSGRPGLSFPQRGTRGRAEGSCPRAVAPSLAQASAQLLVSRRGAPGRAERRGGV